MEFTRKFFVVYKELFNKKKDQGHYHVWSIFKLENRTYYFIVIKIMVEQYLVVINKKQTLSFTFIPARVDITAWYFRR